MATHYETLGIEEGASDEEIRHAYRRLVKAAHPDRAGDPAQFQRITRAYDVLSDPTQRAAYDRRIQPASPAPAPGPAPAPARRRRFGRYALLSVVALVVGTVAWLVVATNSQSVGDDCLVGTWQGEPFEVSFRGSLDGREVEAPIRGGSGVTLRVAEDGTVRTDYSSAAPLEGTDGPYRIVGIYAGRTSEQWRAADGRVRQEVTNASGLSFGATINGRPPDQPLAPTVVDREYPYTCTPTALDLGPYRYTRP